MKNIVLELLDEFDRENIIGQYTFPNDGENDEEQQVLEPMPMPLQLSGTPLPLKPITSAGILPFAIFKKRVFFLLGKEIFDPKYGESDRWCDFSGKIEPNESIVDGACREFYEESAGCIYTLPEIRQKILNNDYLLCSDLYPEKSSSFRTYLVMVPYKDYPSIFRRVKQFIQYPAVRGSVEIIEKSSLEWFSFNDLRDAIFNSWERGRYKKRPLIRARFAENIRRIMNSTNLVQECLTHYASHGDGGGSWTGRA